jgi:hypothetical protein
MKYLKTPYVRLNGKKYGGDLTPEENSSIEDFYLNFADESTSDVYGGTFQGLYKDYKNGEDPADEWNIPINGINNPEKAIAIHDAITSIAKKYNYNSPDKSLLIGGVNVNLFQKLSIPNSYFLINPGNSENILIITNENSILTYFPLPVDAEWEYFVSVDKNGNVLIPKDAYDEDLDVF